MKPPFYHTALKITNTRNAYGDYVASGEVSLKCHVRIINELVTGGSDEQVQSDAMMWFEPDSGVVKGDVIKFKENYYRIERITEARRLHSPSIQFIKCDLLKYGVIS